MTDKTMTPNEVRNKLREGCWYCTTCGATDFMLVEGGYVIKAVNTGYCALVFVPGAPSEDWLENIGKIMVEETKNRESEK